MRRELGIAAPESDWSLPEAITQPSLNINGMHSANVGAQATNVIPDTATAVLDLRLVLGNDPAQQVDRLRAHVRSQGYYVIDHARARLIATYGADVVPSPSRATAYRILDKLERKHPTFSKKYET